MQLRPIKVARHRDRRFLGVYGHYSHSLTSGMWIISTSTCTVMMSNQIINGVIRGVVLNIAEPVLDALGGRRVRHRS